MVRSAGNRKLKAARLAHGYVSQQAFAEALDVGVRQVRRWESESPPWPQEHHQQRLRRVLGMEMEQLGFRPPWQDGNSSALAVETTSPRRRQRPAGAPRRPGVDDRRRASVATYVASITFAHRQMYWAVDPHHLHSAALEHVRMGELLMSEGAESDRSALASAIAESALLVGRIEFFDLRQPDAAAETFTRALQFAGEANDTLLGSAILAHAAFVPGWAGDRTGASDRMAAARAYARRGQAPALMWSWLDAVDAECATRCGDLKDALALIARAESHLRTDEVEELPEWMDWFTPVRLAAFKGNTQLKAGQNRRARETLTTALEALPATDTKQRAVMLADLAAVEVAGQDVQAACTRLEEALDQLSVTWYSAAMDRIRDVRRLLHPWREERCVRDLDDRIFSWEATLTAVRA